MVIGAIVVEIRSHDTRRVIIVMLINVSMAQRILMSMMLMLVVPPVVTVAVLPSPCFRAR